MLKAAFFFIDQQVHASKSKAERPKVSVILPTYCRGDNGLLERSINSVLEQSFEDFELIVVDDGSVDSTASVVRAFVERDPRVVHVRHDRNSGLPALRVNEGVMLARGEYIAYQFDDDQWTRDALKVRVEALDTHPLSGVVFGRALVRMDETEVEIGAKFSYDRLVDCNYIANNTVMHRRSMFEQHGGYDMHLVMRRLCDWDLWLRWARHTRFTFIDEVLSIVDGNMEHSLGKTAQYDAFTSRFQMGRDRDATLTPANLMDYLVDDLRPFYPLGTEKVDEIWRLHVATYSARRREIWPSIPPFVERKSHVIVTKAHYDTNVDITINNLAEYLEGRYVFSFVPTAQLTDEAVEGADIVIFHRTIDAHARDLMEQAKARGKCVIFLMDDDLLSMHELGPEFKYLAPGEPAYEVIAEQIHSADLMLAYSKGMVKSASNYSDKVVELSTNIKEKWLGAASPKADVVRIAFAGGSARRQELEVLWPAIVDVSEEYGSRVQFHFWGFTPEGIDLLKSPVHCEDFTFSYDEYLLRLTRAGFHIMLAPLLTDAAAKRAKCPIKFLEATAAGAVGIYSDVEPYATVEDGVNGIKVENTPAAWRDALQKAIEAGSRKREEMVVRARARIEVEFSSSGQAHAFGAALEAARVQSYLRSGQRTRPRIAYVFHSPYQGGAENHLLRHARIASRHGFEPIVIFPQGNEGTQHEIAANAQRCGFTLGYLPLRVETEPMSRELDQSAVDYIQNWLRQEDIGMVHSVTLMQELSRACRHVGIAHVASLYAVEAEASAPIINGYCDVVHSDSLLYANKWARLLGSKARCIRSHVPAEYFETGMLRGENIEPSGLYRIGMFGTIQPRKGQLQAIEAVGRAKAEHGVEFELHLYGYNHFYAEYMEQCRETVSRWGLDRQVVFHGFKEDTASILSEIDITLCASDWESLPQVILEAMAAGVFVVAPNVGGIAEITSNHNGILLMNNSPDELLKGLMELRTMSADEFAARLHLARQVVHAESSAGAVAWSLFRTYSDAIERQRAKRIEAGQLQDGYGTVLSYAVNGAHHSRPGIAKRTDSARARAVEYAKLLRSPTTQH